MMESLGENLACRNRPMRCCLGLCQGRIARDRITALQTDGQHLAHGEGDNERQQGSRNEAVEDRASGLKGHTSAVPVVCHGWLLRVFPKIPNMLRRTLAIGMRTLAGWSTPVLLDGETGVKGRFATIDRILGRRWDDVHISSRDTQDHGSYCLYVVTHGQF